MRVPSVLLLVPFRNAHGSRTEIERLCMNAVRHPEKASRASSRKRAESSKPQPKAAKCNRKRKGFDPPPEQQQRRSQTPAWPVCWTRGKWVQMWLQRPVCDLTNECCSENDSGKILHNQVECGCGISLTPWKSTEVSPKWSTGWEQTT